MICISCHEAVTGSFTNFLDYAILFQKEYNAEIMTSISYFNSMLQKTYREYDLKHKLLSKQKSIKFLSSDVIFTDFVSLIKLLSGFWILQCDRLILFDNLEVYLFLNQIYSNPLLSRFSILTKLKSLRRFFEMLIKVKNVFFLVTPSISDKVAEQLQFVDKVRVIPYYKKINIPVFKTIKYSSNGKCFSREYVSQDIHMLRSNENPFDYDCYIYRRRQILSFYEMFGRMIFEFILLGKEVKILDPHVQDGLTLYLQKFGTSKNSIEQICYTINQDVRELLS